MSDSIDDSELILFYEHDELIKHVKNNFKRINMSGARKLLNLLIGVRVDAINVKSIQTSWKSFLMHNKGKFEEKGKRNFFLKDEYIELYREELEKIQSKVSKNLSYADKEDYITKSDNEIYNIGKYNTYRQYIKLLCEEDGKIGVDFKEDEDDTLILTKNPNYLSTPQKIKIKINSIPFLLNYITEHYYLCPICGVEKKIYSYKNICTKAKYNCTGIYRYTGADGEHKTKICNKELYPNDSLSKTIPMYYYDITYRDIDNTEISIKALSFEKHNQGYYEAIGFLINSKNNGLLHIISLKKINNNKFEIEDINSKENYLLTLIKSIDKYIESNTKSKIVGMYQIKASLILQKMFELYGKRVGNIMILGDESSGKSFVLKYYGIMINGHLNKSTNANSISIPALRGTPTTISINGIKYEIISKGYMGIYSTIHIEEAAQDKELIKNLKAFLYEDNYSYDKAKGDGLRHVRTAHVNISQNIDLKHQEEYVEKIKKLYNDTIDPNNIGDSFKNDIPFDENIDLFANIEDYNNNTKLKNVITKVRESYFNLKRSWIDGYEFALLGRFPFYFFLSNTNQEEMNKTLKSNMLDRSTSEEFELIEKLKNDDLNNYYIGLESYYKSEHNEKALYEVDNILDMYNLKKLARDKIFYYNLIIYIRMLNKRLTFEKSDFDILKWIIESMGRKLYFSETLKVVLKNK